MKGCFLGLPAGCVVFEIVTGELLFDLPDEDVFVAIEEQLTCIMAMMSTRHQNDLRAQAQANAHQSMARNPEEASLPQLSTATFKFALGFQALPMS